MRYLLNSSTNPYFNLALDEYALKHIDVGEDYFFLWQNSPAVIIGKNQVAQDEINRDFIDKNAIKIARRVSGGGAVYHDWGNLNFTIITNIADSSKVDYHKYTKPVIAALAEMGVKAELSGRNDILIDGLKISGNAQRQAGGRLMHHGTLMFDVNLETLVAALNVSQDKISSKGLKSVKSRVTNIKEHLPTGTTLEQFWEQLQYQLSNKGQDKEIILSSNQLSEIERNATERFGTWQWIYGTAPRFTYRNSQRFSGGLVDVLIEVIDGKIATIRFLGDYLGVNDVEEIEKALINVKYEITEIKKILEEYIITSYFGLITMAEILSIIID